MPLSILADSNFTASFVSGYMPARLIAEFNTFISALYLR